MDKNKNFYRIEINFDVKQAGVATQYVISSKKIRSRFPSLGIEKEFAQSVGRLVFRPVGLPQKTTLVVRSVPKI